jgi:hypothetical protein
MEFMEGIRDLLDNDEEDRLLRRFLDQNLASEPRIHADNRDIRDHLTHVTQVFLTGWIILNSCPVFTRPDLAPYDWPNNRVLENLNRCWLYAALLHDCAYSVEYAKKALGHELAVRNLFQDTYLAGIAGASNADEIKNAANELWEQRSKWRDVPRQDDLHKGQYTRPDHGIVGAIALWKEATEAKVASDELISILKPAALAIACHNFQYLVPDDPEPTCKQDWLRLSLKKEPISVLLHICDELQEWGRERIDEAMIYKQVFKPLRYAATELTRLDVHGHDGLALNVRLLRRLYPEHRPLRHRIAREQERAITKTTRSFERLFGYCADADEEDYHVRLRVQQTVDDVRCKQELRVDWPSPSHSVLNDIHEAAKKRYEASSLKSATLEKVAVQPTDSADPLLWIDESGKASITLPRETTLSVVILAAGAAGKSTLLRRVANNDDSPYRAFYIEQLPEELTDIQHELTDLANGGGPAVLIVDHLDRLVEDETAPFWLEQISAASNIKGLHIVLASRTEEYERYFQASLPGFKQLVWDRKDPLLVKGEHAADANGRLRAHAVESGCKNNPDIRSIGLLATDMGQRRAIDLPRDVNTGWKGDFETRIDIQRIVSDSPTGKARFLHDCLQDFFSAVHIVQCLSEPTASTGVDVMAVRQLERLPRDVVRLLFDLLASEDTTLLSKETKDKAALRLASAFIEEPTIQQWLYDTGRLQQARYAIDAYHKRYSGSPEVEVVARKFLGHIEYENFNVNVEGTHKNAHQAFRNWFKAALAADDLLKDPNKNALKDRYQWFLAFLVDHLFLVLTRFAGIGSAQSAKVREWLRSEVKSGPAGGVLQPGWISSLLEQLGSATSQPEIDEKFCPIDDDLTKVRASSSSSDGIQPLDVRRAHLASHLGNHFLGEGYKRKDKGKIEPTRLNRAGEYFQRSISRRERVLREMEREPFNLRGVEVFSTLCQGYADNAHQYRGVFECLFLSHKCRQDLGNLAVELIQAHRLQEAKWAQARLHRGPSERLPNMFRTSLPWLATGRALTELVESLAADAIGQDEMQDRLKKEEQRLLNDYRQEGEVHARNAANDLAQKSVFGDESKHVAAVLKIAKAGAELLSGGKKKRRRMKRIHF